MKDKFSTCRKKDIFLNGFWPHLKMFIFLKYASTFTVRKYVFSTWGEVCTSVHIFQGGVCGRSSPFSGGRGSVLFPVPTLGAGKVPKCVCLYVSQEDYRFWAEL